MKSILIFLIISTACHVFCQYAPDFDGSPWMDEIYLDLSDTNNVWEVGVPQKTVFTSAHSLPNAIVTDLTDPYASNDTSSFYYRHISYYGFQAGQIANLTGLYMVDSDSNDYGDIFISFDLGTSWTSIFDTNVVLPEWWNTPIPVLTGSSSGWQPFSVNLALLGPQNNILAYDTILFKFSFISDSISSIRDGLMFDSFFIDDYAEGVAELSYGDAQIESIVDPMGRKTEDQPNRILLYKFTDGTIKKVFRME